MARKGQKFKAYTKEFKEIVLREYFENFMTAQVLSEKYDVPAKTVHNWVNKHNHGINVFVDSTAVRKGRPKKEIGDIDYKERYEILKKYQAFLKAQREKK